MRILVEFSIAADIGNDAVKSGKIEKIFRQLGEDLRPEAMYFFPAGGDRAGILVVNTEDPAVGVAIGERLWFGLQAKVKLTPCMNGDDLGKGLSSLPQIIQNYG